MPNVYVGTIQYNINLYSAQGANRRRCLAVNRAICTTGGREQCGL